MAKRKRQKRLPRQVYPRAIEREYEKQLRLLVERTIKSFRPLLAALPGLLEPKADARVDASSRARVRALIAQVRAKLAKAFDTKTLDKLAKRFAKRIERHSTQQVKRQVESAIGVNVFKSDPKIIAKIIAEFAETNKKFMLDLPRELVSRIEELTTNAITIGQRHETLAKGIKEQMGIATRRSKLIARDQVGKLLGQVNEKRQEAIGVERFIWRTVGDQRVRPEHAARNGVEYAWDDPPNGETPGSPVLCRCYAEPVIEGLEGI